MKLSDIGNIYKHIDNWKKLSLFLIISLFIFMLYLIIDNQHLIKLWLQSQTSKTTINKSTLNDISQNLLHDVQGHAVIVWDIDIKKNIIESIYVKKNQTRLSSQEGLGDVLLRQNNTESTNIINVINNESHCYAREEGIYLERKMFGEDISYICSSAIPPNFGEIIGMISVGFKESQHRDDFIKLKTKESAIKTTQ